MKAVLKYPGAKNRIADWICEYIPEHNVYLEPYAGSLAVFFNKKPCYIETINDLHGEVINFYTVLREQPDELIRLIRFTPYARSEYEKSYEDADTDLERARRFCVRCWMGFGAANLYKNGFRSGQRSNSPNPAKAWGMLPETLQAAAERLKNVQIENLPALELIARYNTADVFIYLDPPYLPDTRKGYLYKHEMSIEDHERLLQAIVDHPGKILISGYDNELYNKYLKGWYKVQKSTQVENGLKRVETLWMNYTPDMQLSFI